MDFRAPDEPLCYDSTASVITACGLIEIAKHVHEYEQDLYLNAAINLLKAAECNWCNWDENEDSILQNGTVRYGTEPEPIIYGDFFFTEAILKLKGSEFLPW